MPGRAVGRIFATLRPEPRGSAKVTGIWPLPARRASRRPLAVSATMTAPPRKGVDQGRRAG